MTINYSTGDTAFISNRTHLFFLHPSDTQDNVILNELLTSMNYGIPKNIYMEDALITKLF